MDQACLYGNQTVQNQGLRQNQGYHSAHRIDARESALDKTIYVANFLQGAAEWALDIAGYIPGVSSYSATVRFGLAIGQVIAGVTLKIIAIAGDFFVGDAYSAGINEIDSMGTDEIKHGISNSFRSFFEFFQWINLLCLGFDLLADEDFRDLYDEVDPRLSFNWLGLDD